ncbi:hypothetical protein ACH5RR_029137 [Cinchona calisaya]|uniref:Retrovirus-related Pol polyprotein from transposon TNT 1-94 n=1 Tax=Cinchona calisaya TaxID=153742 RepID=A0ABD2YQS6_9GENT
MCLGLAKKQNSISLCTADAEYIAAGNCCAQLLWMKHMLKYFGVVFDCVPIRCDNISAINLTKNPIMHSITKHIDVKHYFIRDLVYKKEICVDFVSTLDQLADIFTKPLALDRFDSLRNHLGIL